MGMGQFRQPNQPGWMQAGGQAEGMMAGQQASGMMAGMQAGNMAGGAPNMGGQAMEGMESYGNQGMGMRRPHPLRQLREL
jgi:hypothetical protein